MKRIIIQFLTVSLALALLSGCTIIIQKGRRSDIEKIKELSRNLEELQGTKRILEERLKKEIEDKQVRLEMMEKGLVITFVADVLFDSGKATIRTENFSTLDKIALVLKETVPYNYIGIEGHTDNEPIKYSGWKSNWELSTARALSVLHYLVDQKGLPAERFSAIGYGEYRPIASNETKEGRQLNRRVEIVIMPKLYKERPTEKKPETFLKEPKLNLK
ncbi:MAG: flagellar motor protein MotB [Candidatus Omnitrophica bacterium]|nr:flagellar motor protein MotB [Candidatus Omnitrophota bacterium]